MDDEITDREARRLGQHVDRLAGLAARAHQSIAEDVLLADDDEVGSLEALLESEHADTGWPGGNASNSAKLFDRPEVLRRAP
ncbi:MAG: hypothetical protein R3E48_23155 [Burkholderiaceae bacterium]